MWSAKIVISNESTTSPDLVYARNAEAKISADSIQEAEHGLQCVSGLFGGKERYIRAREAYSSKDYSMQKINYVAFLRLSFFDRPGIEEDRTSLGTVPLPKVGTAG